MVFASTGGLTGGELATYLDRFDTQGGDHAMWDGSFRDGQLDALDVDEVLLQYSRAAEELWKFCNVGDVESVATAVREQWPIDWWERGAPRARR